MSEAYKQHIDKLVEDSSKGNTKATKELLDEANKWCNRIDKLKQDRDNNNNDNK